MILGWVIRKGSMLSVHWVWRAPNLNISPLVLAQVVCRREPLTARYFPQGPRLAGK